MANVAERQKILVNWLMTHHKPGEFHSVKEICDNVAYDNGVKCYTFNDSNPYRHDKCIVLSNDVRQLNWSCNDGSKIIIKNAKGGIKLCESMEEFEAWRKAEKEPITRKCEYLNNLVWKARMDGQMTLPIPE